MKKILGTFKLTWMLVSKKKTREVVLMMEVTLMVFLISMAFVPISNALNLASGIEQVSLDASMVYCVPAPSNPNPVPIDNICETIHDISGDEAKVFLTRNFSYTTPDLTNGYMILISKDLFTNTKLDLKKGELLDGTTSIIPVIISSHLNQKYDIGDVIEINLQDNSIVECQITGVLKTNSTFIDVQKQQGNILTLDAIGFNMAKYNGDFIVAVSNSQVSISEEKAEAAIFAFERDTEVDFITEELNKKYKNAYDFHSFESLRENSVTRSISKMEWRLVLLFLFTIVVLFNFIAYIIINTRQKQNVICVMRICGLSFLKSAMINSLSLLLIVLPAVMLGIFCSPYVLDKMNVEYYGYNAFLWVVIAVIFIGTTLLAIITSMWQRKHADIINLYRKG